MAESRSEKREEKAAADARSGRDDAIEQITGRTDPVEAEKAEPVPTLLEASGGIAEREQAAHRTDPKLAEAAMHRELATSRTAGVEIDPADEEMTGPTGLPLLWVVSNRRDNRVVAWWRDPAQPNGEAFVGGPTPAKVALTPEVERLLLSGEAVEVPEPMKFLPDPHKKGAMLLDKDGAPRKNPKYPWLEKTDREEEFAAQPGRAIPLNRELDRDLWDADAIREVKRRQARIPAELPPPIGGIVPGLTHQVA